METIDLSGRKSLVLGIANEHSLAWWAAKHFADAGAELAILSICQALRECHLRAMPHGDGQAAQAVA